MVRMRERFEGAPERRREVKRTSFRDRNMFIVSMVEQLRRMGSLPRATENLGTTPIHVAVQSLLRF